MVKEYFKELLKVAERGELCDIISKFGSEPWVSMRWLWASYIHKSSCNMFHIATILLYLAIVKCSCSLLVSLKNYKLASLQNSLKLEPKSTQWLWQYTINKSLSPNNQLIDSTTLSFGSNNYNSTWRHRLLSVITMFTTKITTELDLPVYKLT